MIGDLARAGGRDTVDRRPLVLGAMRGAALTTIWSPIGLGFAIVTAGIPSLDPLKLMGLAFVLTVVMLMITAIFPLLPAEARTGRRARSSATSHRLRRLPSRSVSARFFWPSRSRCIWRRISVSRWHP